MQSLEVPETPFSGRELQESQDGNGDAKDSSSQHTSPSGMLSGFALHTGAQHASSIQWRNKNTWQGKQAVDHRLRHTSQNDCRLHTSYAMLR